MSHAIAVQPLSPFGALVDLDLAREPAPDLGRELARLLYAHQVLVFCGQRLDAQQHLRVNSYFGPIPEDGVEITSNDPTVGAQGSIALAFHSDLAFAPEPDLGASLYALDLVPDVSSTSFASALNAYAKLPAALKARIAGLEALSVFPIDQTRRNRAAGLRPEDPRSAHPVAWTHPVTGQPLLYLTQMQTDCILGLPEAESEALIEELFGYLFAPDNILEHRWRVGDLVVWDNRATQHGRRDVSQVGIRTMRRISISRRSFREQFPQFQVQASGFIDRRHEGAAAVG
ncbi:MAG: TauD/TfdA dioxygenase family protein [Gammaproteobacteria bacterium]